MGTLPIAAQGETRVGLVVDKGDGEPILLLVTLSMAEPTGLQVLEASGLELTLDRSGMGVAVCAIAGTGCPVTRCFCESPDAHWSYWFLKDGQWQYSPVGASLHRTEDGGVEAWTWGPSSPPPLVTFEEIVASAYPLAEDAGESVPDQPGASVTATAELVASTPPTPASGATAIATFPAQRETVSVAPSLTATATFPAQRETVSLAPSLAPTAAPLVEDRGQVPRATATGSYAGFVVLVVLLAGGIGYMYLSNSRGH
jgi:hypothetical protein